MTINPIGNRRAMVKHPKARARSLKGVEKCPICGALQDWKDRFMTVDVADGVVGWWKCHACGHEFRTWRDQILELGWWPSKRRDGTYGLVKVEVSKRSQGYFLRREEKSHNKGPLY